MRTVLFLFGIALGWTALGWTQPSKPARSPAPPDAILEKDIQARFAKSKISINRFQVKVQGGVATIDGRTEIIQHKGTATRLAKLAGARQVRNRIEVSQKAREKAAANLEAGRRRAQVRRGEPRAVPRSLDH